MDMDAVVLWVNGGDPAWLAEKKKFQPPAEADSDSINRYRDWGLLPYWFRSVEKFMPWVRKIHFVTWGHVPEFLNLQAPKLHVVRHSDFIPERFLPTFSSHAIEMNIHRIPDLAEHFVYFNDDMFLLRPMEPEQFFRDGLPCTYGGEEPWTFQGEIGVWEHAVANNMGVVNAHFPKRQAVADHGKKYTDRSYRWKDNVRTKVLEKLFPDSFTGFRNLHAPASYLKSTFRQVWEAEPEKLETTCREKFRAPSGVNQWVCLWWQVASGQFAPYVVDNLVSSITPETADGLCAAITGQSHDFLCLNDPEQEVDFEVLSRKLQDAFQELLPEKSSFER